MGGMGTYFFFCVFISQKPQLRGSGIKGQPPCLVGWSAAATILLLLVVRETCKHAKRFNAAFLLSVCCVKELQNENIQRA
jgi:hypothetical protein